MPMTKYIFITGGVLSSLGKGIATASLGLLLKQRGFSVTAIKLDPYINVDPGTMNPYQHGEVYVTDDGAETDLDLGHYERFMNITTSRLNNATAGQVYYEVIQRERKGYYLGRTVQVVPHITDEIKRRMTLFDGQHDIVLIEIGGTVGDIESLPFLEAARQLCLERGPQNTLTIHLTYVPFIRSAGEVKTKPTQHSVKALMESGIRPDILLCRTEQRLSREIRSKIALFCNVDEEAVIEALDVETIYEVPQMFARRGLDVIVLRKLGLQGKPLRMERWNRFVQRIKNPRYAVTIALVGKYTQYRDSYKSILEALTHAGSVTNTRVHIRWVSAEELSLNGAPEDPFDEVDGILVAPGFGSRGVEGKIAAAGYARRRNIPYFGICLGMQCAVIEFARNVCGWADAHSAEFARTAHNVIDLLPEQRRVKQKGGTMRLGAYPCVLRKGTKAWAAYRQELVYERHRHRYEVNPEFIPALQEHGLLISGTSPDGRLVEIVELPQHRWFVAVQFHPEFKSRVPTGHPLFVHFVRAALRYRQQRHGEEAARVPVR
ncbi:CTP synthase [bacterium HR21]|nr:CTP synthase [bacterium HR21]